MSPRSAFLAASKGTWDKVHYILGLSHVPLHCAGQPCPLFEQALLFIELIRPAKIFCCEPIESCSFTTLSLQDNPISDRYLPSNT